MIIYMAGAQGWGKYCNKHLFGNDMDLYLAGHSAEKNRTNNSTVYKDKIYILESFYYVKDWMIPYIKNYWNFMLDSGAFTFMQNTKKDINWDKYLESYADFINKYDIKLFFELDVDSVLGIKKVEKMRNRLESLTGKKSIPVWHKYRGKQYFLDMCKNYDYVAIGGIVNKEIKRKDFDLLPWFINEAHKNNCKIHGLGFTKTNSLKKYKFDSIDSTAWIYGNRCGFLYFFTGNNIIKKNKPNGTRLKGKEVAIHNFKEWVKYQRWAKDNL